MFWVILLAFTGLWTGWFLSRKDPDFGSAGHILASLLIALLGGLIGILIGIMLDEVYTTYDESSTQADLVPISDHYYVLGAKENYLASVKLNDESQVQSFSSETKILQGSKEPYLETITRVPNNSDSFKISGTREVHILHIPTGSIKLVREAD
jgi:hypothetical protein